MAAGCHIIVHFITFNSQPTRVLGPTTTVVSESREEESRGGTAKGGAGDCGQRQRLTRHLRWSSTSRVPAAETRLCGNAVTSVWEARLSAYQTPVGFKGFRQGLGAFLRLRRSRHLPFSRFSLACLMPIFIARRRYRRGLVMLGYIRSDAAVRVPVSHHSGLCGQPMARGELWARRGTRCQAAWAGGTLPLYIPATSSF